MSKVKAMLLSAVVVCVLGVAPSVASAFPGPFYHVAGAKIGSTAKELTISIKSGTTMKLNTEHLGIAIEAVCKAVKAETAVFFNASLQGESEMKSLVFGECTVAKPAAGCSVTGGGFTTRPIYSFLDYETNPEPNRTKITTYFRPTKEEEFAVVQLGGLLCSGTYKVTGSVVANNSPERTEAKELELTFPSTPITRTWDTVAGEKFKEYSAGLEIEKKPAVLSGSIIANMVSGEKFGVYDE
jgi:hypothetical protein